MLDDQRSTVARLVKVTFAGAAKAEQGHNTRTSGHLSVFGDWRILPVENVICYAFGLIFVFRV